jgi:hypothetical protein
VRGEGGLNGKITIIFRKIYLYFLYIKAIPNSNPEKAIINANGNNPNIKKIIPELIILYVNPLSIFREMCQMLYMLKDNLP